MDKVNTEYNCVLTEVSEIFKYFDNSLLEKIPQKLIDIVNKNKNNDYIFKYDKTKTLDEQKLKAETRSFISLIYLSYCCDESEKQRLLKICRQNDENEQKEIYIKYNPDNIFGKRNRERKEMENQSLIDFKKEKWYKKLISKIKKWFRKY